MAMTFIVQGSVMRNFGIVDAPMMNNADAVSVLAFGYLIGNVLYPELNRRGIKIPTTYKFAIGSGFGAWAVGCAIVTDYRIHHIYRETGEAATVLWQVFPYLLIGIGEIFAVSAAYELVFMVVPTRMKSIASAANLYVYTSVQLLQLVVPQRQRRGQDTQIARLREREGRQLLLGCGGDSAPRRADQRPAVHDELGGGHQEVGRRDRQVADEHPRLTQESDNAQEEGAQEAAQFRHDGRPGPLP